MTLNFGVMALAALIPMVMGFIWYNPKTLGKIWMKATGLTEEDAKGGNMPLIFGLSYVFSFLITMPIAMIVIHQWGVFSALDPNTLTEGSENLAYFTDFMTKYGANFRTFGHGAFHGVITGLFLITPIIATGAMFEKKGFKYIAVNAGYWIVCLALMGGVICQFS